MLTKDEAVELLLSIRSSTTKRKIKQSQSSYYKANNKELNAQHIRDRIDDANTLISIKNLDIFLILKVFINPKNKKAFYFIM